VLLLTNDVTPLVRPPARRAAKTLEKELLSSLVQLLPRHQIPQNVLRMLSKNLFVASLLLLKLGLVTDLPNVGLRRLIRLSQ
jgi:hypothetical protein